MVFYRNCLMLSYLKFFCCLCVLFLVACVSFDDYKEIKSDLDKERTKNEKLAKLLSENKQDLNTAKLERNILAGNTSLSQKEKEDYLSIVSQLERFKSSVDVGTLNVRVSGRRAVLVLPADVLFDSGSAVLSKKGSRTITQITQILKGNINCKYQIEGHTDNVPIHTPRFPSNWELASTRALKVLHTMVAAGMSPSFLSTASFADTRPIQSNDKKEGREANRRIEIALIPDISTLKLSQ